MEEPKTQDHTLSLFKAITSFVTSLNECYGPTQKTLQLYARLISKTTLMDDTPINRHIEAFKIFCAANKDAILEKNNQKFVEERISYNERVYIDMAIVFKQASGAEKKIIWKHLLSIFALIDPQSKAKDILKDFLKKDGNGGKEEEFLSDIFDKVGNNIDSEGNPLQAVGNLMSSGLFTDIVGSMSTGLESGELDLGKLMGSMQGMVSGIGNMAQQDGQEQPPEMTEMLGQMNAMMGNLNKMTQQTEESGKTSEQDIERGSELVRKMTNSQNPVKNAANEGSGIAGLLSAAAAAVTGVPADASADYGIGDLQSTGPTFEIVDEARVAPDKVSSVTPNAAQVAPETRARPDTVQQSMAEPNPRTREVQEPSQSEPPAQVNRETSEVSAVSDIEDIDIIVERSTDATKSSKTKRKHRRKKKPES